MEFLLDDLSDDEVAQHIATYEPLTRTVRDLIDATIRTQVDDATARAAHRHIAEAVALLRTDQLPGAYGVRHTASGQGMAWGNAVTGLRNAVAPPLTVIPVTGDDTVVARAELVLGAAYEGPTGHVHGGVVALLFDHLLGEAASMDGSPNYTGTLTIRYHRPTPLGALLLEAAPAVREGRKKFARATMTAGGVVTATADGVFIVPRAADG